MPGSFLKCRVQPNNDREDLVQTLYFITYRLTLHTFIDLVSLIKQSYVAMVLMLAKPTFQFGGIRDARRIIELDLRLMVEKFTIVSIASQI